MNRFIYTIVLLVFTNCQLYSQSGIDNNDFVAKDENIATETVKLMMKADSMALADSINMAILKRQMDELRSSETAKRKRIETELSRLQRADSLQKTKLIDEVKRLKERSIGYPVVPNEDTLFTIYTKIGSLTAEERAEVINDRMKRLYQDYFIKSDSLILSDNGQVVDIFYKDRIIISITELDALWFGRNKFSIASDYRDKIVHDIYEFKKDRSFFTILKEIGLAVLVILLQIALIKAINYVFRIKVNSFLLSKKDIWFVGIKLKNYQIVDSETETKAILVAAKILRYAVILLLLYLTIPIIFSIFPPTRRIAEVLFGYILSPVKRIGFSVINYIPELITIIVIVVITRYILKFLKFLTKEIENGVFTIPGFFPDWAKPTYNIIKVLIVAFAFVVVFPYLPGSDSNVFKGVSVFLGIVFSLGSSSVIGNMVAGLVITYMRPFQIGDRIKIGEVLGDVVEKTPFVTRLKTPKKEYITIPNSSILASSVVNYSTSRKEDGIILHTTVTIGYDVPWRKVHKLLIDAAKKTSHINQQIEPFVLQTSLDDFYVSYQLNAHTNEPNLQPAVYSELHQNIQDAFNEAGVEIMSPHYRSERDGNQIAIPFEYLPEDYEKPGFRIEQKKSKL